jgi:hypothetical protein
MCLKDEAESKMDKFLGLLEADLLNFQALKELSWSGVPRKVKFKDKFFDSQSNRNL